MTGAQSHHAPTASPLSGWRRLVAAAGPAHVSPMLHQPGWCYRGSAFSTAVQRGRPEAPFPPHYMQSSTFTHVPSRLCPSDIFSFTPKDHCPLPVSLESTSPNNPYPEGRIDFLRSLLNLVVGKSAIRSLCCRSRTVRVTPWQKTLHSHLELAGGWVTWHFITVAWFMRRT